MAGVGEQKGEDGLVQHKEQGRAGQGSDRVGSGA